MDICNTTFVKAIFCDRVISPLHSIENLLAENQQVSHSSLLYFSPSKPSGFMVEKFVKPPVTLSLEFVQPFSVSSIRLGLRLGTQQTTGLQIFAGDCSSFLKKVAAVYLAPNDQICSVEFSHRNRAVYSTSATKDVRSMLYFSNVDALKSCKYLAIKITQANYVPCLSFLRVFSTNVLSECQNDSGAVSDVTTAQICHGVASESKAEGASVPEEFFDPITSICMCLPLTLPCGKNVDKLTLDKYFEEEAKYGRKPNDPFTAVPFKNTFPVPNSALKERIDKFFLNNSEKAAEQNFGKTCCTGKQFALIYSPPS